MALLELIFTLPKNSRTVSFDKISMVTCLPKNQVELLVIQAMSLELIKGNIDQVT
jgi:26S proteasome regulatory subunit N9